MQPLQSTVYLYIQNDSWHIDSLFYLCPAKFVQKDQESLSAVQNPGVLIGSTPYQGTNLASDTGFRLTSTFI